MRIITAILLSCLLIVTPAPIRAQSGCGAYSADEWLSINEGGTVLSYQDLLADGTLTNATLSPEIYDYLVTNGYLPNQPTVAMTYETYTQYVYTNSAFPAAIVLVTLPIPVAGQVVIFVAGGAAAIYLSYQAGKAIGAWVAARKGNSDPLAVSQARASTVDSGRDANGNCLPKPNGYKWQARDKFAHQGEVHWHWIDYQSGSVNMHFVSWPEDGRLC